MNVEWVEVGLLVLMVAEQAVLVWMGWRGRKGMVPHDPAPTNRVASASPANWNSHSIVKWPSLDHIGYRHAGHPDIREALATPGLAVKGPDGRVEEGVQ